MNGEICFWSGIGLMVFYFVGLWWVGHSENRKQDAILAAKNYANAQPSPTTPAKRP